MSMKVLISDPDWQFVARATAYLESHAHLVVTEPQGDLALAHAEHWHPDLVIVTAELCEQNGLLGSFAAIEPRPAVLLTEHMYRYDRAWRAWQKGGDELLLKPVFNSRELHQAITTAMENATVAPRSGRDSMAVSA